MKPVVGKNPISGEEKNRHKTKNQEVSCRKVNMNSRYFSLFLPGLPE
jgi:hypothetical protein